MARPKNKEELLNQSGKSFMELFDFIAAMPDENITFSGNTMNRNVRDVLMHLHQWHLMMLDWYNVGMKGSKASMPAKDYTWKDTPQLNRKIWEDNQNIPLIDAKELLKSSYRKIQDIIKKHSNEELFDKKRYKWTGSTSLGSYLISATTSHYDWGIKLIKKATKNNYTN